jgi:nicotinamidase-related amidase
MLNDFVTGALGCERGRAIVPAVERLLGAARRSRIPVIYTNDSHLAGTDGELGLWGDHAIAGTPGAEVIPQLTPQAGDYVVPKRRYSGFFQTGLHLLLRELQVDRLILTGLYAHICVRHTAADAYYWGFELVVPPDATDSFTQEDYDEDIRYMHEVYAAELTAVDQLIAGF